MGDSAGGGLCAALMEYLKNYIKNPIGNPIFPLPLGSILLSPWLDVGYLRKIERFANFFYSCSQPSWETNGDYDWLPSRARHIHEKLSPGIDSIASIYIFGEDPERKLKYRKLPKFIDRRDSGFISPLFDLNFGYEKLPSFYGCEESSENSGNRKMLTYMVKHPLVSPMHSIDFKGLPPCLIQVGSCELLMDETLRYAERHEEANKDGSARHELYTDMVHVFHAITWLPIRNLAFRNIASYIRELEGEEFIKDVDDKKLVIVNSHHSRKM